MWQSIKPNIDLNRSMNQNTCRHSSYPLKKKISITFKCMHSFHISYKILLNNLSVTSSLFTPLLLNSICFI